MKPFPALQKNGPIDNVIDWAIIVYLGNLSLPWMGEG